MAHTRRDFLCGAGCGLLSGSAFLSGFNRYSLMSAFAQERAGGVEDYKALVCIFLFGGNDSNNMVIPIDQYSDYAAARSGAQFAIPQDQLLSVTPATPQAYSANFGLHPNMTEVQSLFNQQKLAFIVNAGTLMRPISKADYLSGAARPQQLFSHSDQQNQWQDAKSDGASQTGWGGRSADRIRAMETFPIVTSIAGVNLFGAGNLNRPLVISAAPTPLDQVLRIQRTDPAIDALLVVDQSGGPTLVQASSAITQQAIANSQALATDPVIATTFPNTSLANQLKQIAKLISLRSTLGMRRQIFFASLGGFDTHTGQQAGQGGLLMQVSQALDAFYNATVELGVSGAVTSFTVSDFTRTMKPGGGNTGTDHAWGGHHLVMGDSVVGGDFYGTYPTLVPNGPDDTDTGSGARGRWIPTTSVDQYGATLGTWLGLTADDLSIVFPNIGAFSSSDLGFMRAA